MFLLGFLFLVALHNGSIVNAFYYRQPNEPQTIPIFFATNEDRKSDAFQPQPALFMIGSDVVSMDSQICSGGFVEHCLIQANQDGEQQLLSKSTIDNQTDLMVKDRKISIEFDGMCQIVIRFLDCINLHHQRCNPSLNNHQNLDDDVFYQSWKKMCDADSKTRNKYLQHGKCIKHALSNNNGQEQCQEIFQSYFMSPQFTMDSIENTVQHGCCAFNKWQHCIDSLIQQQCGSEAVQAIQNLIEEASGGLYL
ncbi:hypothetical protein QR98_0054720 [Sarcoptes scabiei]|uniref:Uncharacterized protein n=1 Tax=Sarcoptes scabiei TaxID=52283 RepID=A0A132A971_SARSC|nr:hypothetical protein QR98_0054720 [Sarcoptes scabiei]